MQLYKIGAKADSFPLHFIGACVIWSNWRKRNRKKLQRSTFGTLTTIAFLCFQMLISYSSHADTGQAGLITDTPSSTSYAKSFEKGPSRRASLLTAMDRCKEGFRARTPQGAGDESGAADEKILRLTGVVISGKIKTAIFVLGNGEFREVAEGETLSRGLIKSISQDNVLLVRHCHEIVFSPSADITSEARISESNTTPNLMAAGTGEEATPLALPPLNPRAYRYYPGKMPTSERYSAH